MLSYPSRSFVLRRRAWTSRCLASSCSRLSENYNSDFSYNRLRWSFSVAKSLVYALDCCSWELSEVTFSSIVVTMARTRPSIVSRSRFITRFSLRALSVYSRDFWSSSLSFFSRAKLISSFLLWSSFLYSKVRFLFYNSVYSSLSISLSLFLASSSCLSFLSPSRCSLSIVLSIYSFSR